MYTAAPMGRIVSAVDEREKTPASSRTVLDAVLDRLEGRGSPAHQVWLPPLTESPRLESLLQRVGPCAPLTVPIGLVDCPFEQRREFLAAQLAGARGNVAIVVATVGQVDGAANAALGWPRQTIRATSSSTAWTSGGALSSLSTLPHVGSVAGRRDVELIRRTVVSWSRCCEPVKRDGTRPRRPPAGPIRRRLPRHRRLGHHSSRVRRL